MSQIKTIQQLIEMKQEINDKRNEIKTMYIESLGTDVTYRLATRAEAMQVRKMDDIDVDPYLIYTHVIEPSFKDVALQSAFNTGNKPYMVVDALLNMQEVSKLSLAIIGTKQGDLVKDLKN